MGFSEDQARNALDGAGGDLERAARPMEWADPVRGGNPGRGDRGTTRAGKGSLLFLGLLFVCFLHCFTCLFILFFGDALLPFFWHSFLFMCVFVFVGGPPSLFFLLFFVGGGGCPTYKISFLGPFQGKVGGWPLCFSLTS